ncbi:MAG: putative zinc-binding protein [Deltaproteobacteria bacterium]|nr:putative zinc-binding protein [Deltaproteobacteria bacterium]
MTDDCCAEESNRMIIWCSGAANVGQMTNRIAVELSEEGYGRLFCLAGIAAHRSGFVRSVKDAEDMLVLDGCPIACARKIIEHVEATPKNHFILTELGVEKKMSSDLDREALDRVKETIKSALQANRAAGAALPAKD